MDSNVISEMMLKPLWQLTCEEFCELLRFAILDNHKFKMHIPLNRPQYAYGIHDLAMQIGCCDSSVHFFRKNGILDNAIVSQIGKKIVFDVEKARTLASNYQQEKRASHKQDNFI